MRRHVTTEGAMRGVGLVLVTAALACAPSRESPRAVADATADSVAAERARAAATALGKELQGALLAQLERGGPGSAIAYCADSAQALTARHAAVGTYVRRVSLKVRNRANRPDSLERLALESLARSFAQGALPNEVREYRDEAGTRALHYLRPIVIQPQCLVCHGEPAAIDPGVVKVLRARYPVDSAVGYKAGELRGAISVRVPVQP